MRSTTSALSSRAEALCDEDVALNRRIREANPPLVVSLSRERGRPANILARRNAGWLATVDWGAATAPIDMAYDRGVPLRVFVDETRPRNQGGALAALAHGQHSAPQTVIVDNAGGDLMQRDQIDRVIVEADRAPRATGRSPPASPKSRSRRGRRKK